MSVCSGVERYPAPCVGAEANLANDGRLVELLRKGEIERGLTRELVEVHEQIAALASALLPSHVSDSQIAEVVDASGYSRALIDALCGVNHPWNLPALVSASTGQRWFLVPLWDRSGAGRAMVQEHS